MEEYKKVDDITEYVNQGIKNGTLIPRQAEKYTRIIAKQGNVGETVISWSVDNLGNEIQEKVAQVKVSEETNQPDWIATKVNETGEVVVDDNGHINQWGSDMKIAAGGFINITNVDDMYGISQRDFEDTYKFIDSIKPKISR